MEKTKDDKQKDKQKRPEPEWFRRWRETHKEESLAHVRKMVKERTERWRKEGRKFASPETERSWKESQAIAQRKNMTEEKKAKMRIGTRNFIDTHPERYIERGKQMSQTPASIANRERLYEKRRRRSAVVRNTQMYKENRRIKPVIKPIQGEDDSYYDEFGDFFGEGL